jgi:hypothetical protein
MWTIVDPTFSPCVILALSPKVIWPYMQVCISGTSVFWLGYMSVLCQYYTVLVIVASSKTMDYEISSFVSLFQDGFSYLGSFDSLYKF